MQIKFTKNLIKRYSRQIILKKIGVSGQKKIFSSNVLIIGAGGLGSPISIYLAAMGVGKIGIIDKDYIEISNLSRQIIFSTNDLKKNKSSTAINKLRKINPDIELKSFNKKLTRKNITQIAKDYNLMVDGSDNKLFAIIKKNVFPLTSSKDFKNAFKELILRSSILSIKTIFNSEPNVVVFKKSIIFLTSSTDTFFSSRDFSREKKFGCKAEFINWKLLLLVFISFFSNEYEFSSFCDNIKFIKW